MLLFEIFNQQCEEVGQTALGSAQWVALTVKLFKDTDIGRSFSASLRMTAGRVVESSAAYSLRTAGALIAAPPWS